MTFPLADDDELTALYDAQIPRVDLVRSAASGVPRFLLAKQAEDAAGLLDAAYVRDLIGKSEPDPEPQVEVEGPVSLSGSPAAMAAFIHKAAVEKAKNDTADRKHKAATGAAMPNESYPIADEADLGKAIHAVGRGGASHDSIRKHIIQRARSLGASSKIPDNWNSDGSLKGDSVSKTVTVTKDIGPDLDSTPADDGMDLTTPLAEPQDDSAPGDPTTPGSPAWENIDAATAQKWTSIAVRLKNALAIMADREMLEAVTADAADADNAMDLQDAMCAVDYAIDTLASFAVGEQAEATLGTEAQLALIGKALSGFDPGQVDTLEGLTAIRKAGRVLSSANETKIRDAAAALQSVLASLPSAPQATDSGQPVAKEKGTAVAGTETQTEPAQATEPVEKAGAVPDAPPADGPADPDAPETPADVPPAAPVTKADGDGDGEGDGEGDGGGKPTMQAVFDDAGNLVGIVDPADMFPVTGTSSSKPAKDALPGDETPAGPPADDTPPEAPVDDTAPQPAADAGIPAHAVPDDKKVVKEASDETASDPVTMTPPPDFATQVAKSVTDTLTTAFEDQATTFRETIAKQATVIEGQAAELEAVKKRVEEIAEQPAAPKVFTNGAVPPAGSLRGQDTGGQPVDVAKAQELKQTLYRGTAREQNDAFGEMQRMAIDKLADMHAQRR